MKKLTTFVLVALALAGATVAVLKAGRPSSGYRQTPSESSAPALPASGVVVTYFTTDVRCPSCHKIEELTRNAVAAEFPQAVAAGEVLFRVINTDRPENAHFVKDYSLVSKTVIVAARKDGRETGFTNLQDVWLKLNDPADFTRYIAEAVRARGGPSLR